MMKTKWKSFARRLLALVLCMAMILPVLPQGVWAANTTGSTTGTTTPITYYCGLSVHTHGDTCYSTSGALTCNITAHTHTAICEVNLSGIQDDRVKKKITDIIEKLTALPTADEVRAKLSKLNANAALAYKQELYAQYDEVNQIYISWYEAQIGGNPAGDYRKFLSESQHQKYQDLRTMWTQIGYFALPYAAEDATIKLFDYGPLINEPIENQGQGYLPFYRVFPEYSYTVDGAARHDYDREDAGGNQLKSDAKAPILNIDSSGLVGFPYIVNGVDPNNYPNSKTENGSWLTRAGSLQYLFDPVFADVTKAEWMANLRAASRSGYYSPYAETGIETIYDKRIEDSTAGAANSAYQFRSVYLPVRNNGEGTGLFQKNADGYWYYDSGKNAAWYNPNTEKFELYNYTVIPGHEAYDIYGGTSNGNFIPFNKGHEEGQRDYQTKESLVRHSNGNILWDNVVNAVVGGPVVNQKGQTLELLRENFRLKNINRTNSVNVNFGMVVEFDFYMPKDGQIDGKDMEFIFRGDDDVWVFIDDVLVLDIGGCHDAQNASINFATGKLTQPTGAGYHKPNTIATAFTNAGKTEDIEGNTFTEYSVHTLKFFYMERGGNVSSCRMIFNIPQLNKNTLNISKELTPDVANTQLLGNPDYYFSVLEQGYHTPQQSKLLFIGARSNGWDSVTQITKYKVKNKDGSYVLDENGNVKEFELKPTDYGIFTLKAGQTAVFEGLKADPIQFYVQEMFKDEDRDQFMTGSDGEAFNGTVNGGPEFWTSKISWDSRLYFPSSYNSYIGPNGYTWWGASSPIMTGGDQSAFFTDFNNLVDVDTLAELRITKKVNGYQDDTETLFNINVMLDGDPLPEGTTYTVKSGYSRGVLKEVKFDAEGNSYVELAAGETAYISNILSGSKFKIWESPASSEHFAVTYSGDSTNDCGERITYTADYAEGYVHVDDVVNLTVTNVHHPFYNYCFYLVNEKGEPINSSGAAGTFANSYKFNASLQRVMVTGTYTTTLAKTVFNEFQYKDEYQLYDPSASTRVTTNSGKTTYTVDNTNTVLTSDNKNTTYVVYGSNTTNNTSTSNIAWQTNAATVYFAVTQKLGIKYSYYLVNSEGQPLKPDCKTTTTKWEEAFKLVSRPTLDTVKLGGQMVISPADYFETYCKINRIDSTKYAIFDRTATATVNPDVMPGSENHSVALSKTSTYVDYSTEVNASNRGSVSITGDDTLYGTEVSFAVVAVPKDLQVQYSFYLVDENGNPMDRNGNTQNVTWENAYKLTLDPNLGSVDLSGELEMKPADYFQAYCDLNGITASKYIIYNEGASATITPDMLPISENHSVQLSSTTTYVDYSDTVDAQDSGPVGITSDADLNKTVISFAVKAVPRTLSVKYSFYLVDENGKPMDANGNTKDANGNDITWENAYKLTLNTPQLGTVGISASDELTPEEYFQAYCNLNGIEAYKYTIYDKTATATVNPDLRPISANHTVVLNKTTTYVDHSGLSNATASGTVNASGDEVLNTTEISFAVKANPRNLGVKYSFYLVDENGKPMDANGNTKDANGNDITWENAYKLTLSPTLGDLGITGSKTMYPNDYFQTYCTANGIEATKYTIFDNSATATVTPDLKPSSANHTIGLSNTTTYVKHSGMTNAVASGPVNATGDAVLNTTEISFAVKANPRNLGVKYSFYLVDENGKPMDANGNTKDANGKDITWENAYKLTLDIPKLGSVGISAADTLTPEEYFQAYCTANGIEASKYTIFDKDATATVTPDFKPISADHTIALNKTTTYVKHSGLSKAVATDTVSATGDAVLNSTEISFAVKAKPRDLSVKYSFYLVDEEGNPLKPNGDEGSWEEAYKLALDPKLGDATISSADDLTPEEFFQLYCEANDIDASKYIIFDPSDTATVTPDLKPSTQNHNVDLSGNTTYVKYSEDEPAKNTGDVDIIGDDNLKATEISFAVKAKPRDLSVKYSFYLVDENGKPMDANGNTKDANGNDITWENAYKLTLNTPKLGSVGISAADTLTPEEYFQAYCTANGIDASKYIIFAEEDTAIVTPDLKPSTEDHKVNLPGTSTYVKYSKDEAAKNIDPVYITGDDNLKETEISFAVKAAPRDLSVKYSFYLVDENGNPLKPNGEQGTWEEAYKLPLSPDQLGVIISGEETLTPEEYFQKYSTSNSTVASKYTIYNADDTATVIPDLKPTSEDHKVNLPGTSTYVNYTGIDAAQNNGDVNITGDGVLNTTVISFAVKAVPKKVTVQYSFYLVDENGKPVDENGNETTWEDAHKLVEDPNLGSVDVNGETTLTPEEYLEQYCEKNGLDPSIYEVYDPRHTATVTPDMKPNTEDHTVTLPGDTTYVDYPDADEPQNNGQVDVPGDDNLNKVEISFAVRLKPVLHEDVVVIDYGLSVEIDVLDNDQNLYGDVVVDGIALGNEEVTQTLTATKLEANYGTMEIVTVNGKTLLEYTPNTMEMPGKEVFTYQVKENYGGADRHFHSTVTVIPATIIYYEDDLADANGSTVIAYNTYTMVFDSNGYWVEDRLETPSGWFTDGTTVARDQAQDRPGEDVDNLLGNLDADNVYGYDEAVDGMTALSMGSAHGVTVDEDTYATAEFTFWGTGFDVVGLTNPTTGSVLATVHKVKADGSVDPNTVTSVLVDTYYGYKYVDGRWVVDPDADTMYQIPVIKIKDLPYGQYKAVITVSYLSFMDHLNAGTSSFWLDAIRIYDPANDGANDAIIEGAYTADGEGWPEYFELRNLILTRDQLDHVEGDLTMEGVVFIDNTADVNEYDISDYKYYGPNNDLCLAPDQTIAFTLDVPEEKLAGIHMAMRSFAQGGQLSFYTLEGDAMVPVEEINEKTSRISTATDRYYDISALNGKTVAITNTGDVLVSVTNVKVTYTEKCSNALEQGFFSAARVQEVISSMNKTEADDSVVTQSGDITMSHASLILEDEVHLNYYFTLTGDALAAVTEGKDAGLLIWNIDPRIDGGNATYGTAETVVKGVQLNGSNYMCNTPAIPAKKLGDTVYVRVYVDNGNGYTYGPVVGYSPKTYAYNILAKSTNSKMKQLCIALLNYGAEAQIYFGYRTDELVNERLTDVQKQLGYTDSMIKKLPAVNTDYVGKFEENRGTVFSGHYPSVTFGGAFAINYYLKLNTPADSVTFYYWNSKAYNDALWYDGELTAENATGSQQMVGAGNKTYRGEITGIAAKQMNEVYYITAVYEVGGKTYCTGVLTYSLNTYCAANAYKANIGTLAQATAVYGYYAEKFFGK